MTEREMKRRRAARKARERKARNRRVALTLCLMLAVCLASVGGTLAWLTATTTPVENTFSPSNIGLTLDETNKGPFKMVPGTTVAKDPVVKLESDVPAYVFVMVDESWTHTFGEGNDVRTYDLDDFLTYSLNLTGWTQGDGVEIPANVYYLRVKADAATKEWYILKGGSVNANGEVTYNDSITKKMMDDLETLDATEYPVLVFKAAAVQQDNLTVEQAYDQIKSNF